MIWISENVSDMESYFQALSPAGLGWWIQEAEPLLHKLTHWIHHRVNDNIVFFFNYNMWKRSES